LTKTNFFNGDVVVIQTFTLKDDKCVLRI